MGLPNLEQRKKFVQIFGVQLTAFFNPLVPALGFDIVKFDEYLKKHKGYDEEKDGGTSLKDFVLADYGQDALDFIGEIISL